MGGSNVYFSGFLFSENTNTPAYLHYKSHNKQILETEAPGTLLR